MANKKANISISDQKSLSKAVRTAEVLRTVGYSDISIEDASAIHHLASSHKTVNIK
jgi:hypothetical protein